MERIFKLHFVLSVLYHAHSYASLCYHGKAL